MDKHLDLIKKIKALADRGIGGEAKNAKTLLDKLLLKHNMTIEDIEEETPNDYFFKCSGLNATLLHQIAKRVNYNIKCYAVPAKIVKQYKLTGNNIITCSAAEFIKRSLHPIHRFLAWMGCKLLTLIENILTNSIKRCFTD